MRVLILGATGLLGRVLVSHEQGGNAQVIGVGSRDGDIANSSEVQRLFTAVRPDITILSAAYTDVDGCEQNPQKAYAVNCAGAVNVAIAAREGGSRLLFLSTDYVFDGLKNAPYEAYDAICPINVYGRAKAEAEKQVEAALPLTCIVRTSWLFGSPGRCFPNTILEIAQSRSTISVVDDQFGCPTFTRDLAGTIVRLAQMGATGIIHATNSGVCSWFEFASEIVHIAGLDHVTVKPASTEDVLRPAKRPKHSALSATSLRQHGLSMRPWKETLAEFLSDRREFLKLGSMAALGAQQ